MDKIVPLVELRRFAKHYVFLPDLEFFLDPLYPFEKYQFDIACTIGKNSYQAGAFAAAGQRHALDGAAQLDIGACGVYLADCIELAAVHIAERESVEHILERSDAKLLFQKLGPFWPDPRQKLDFTVQNIAAHIEPKVKN